MAFLVGLWKAELQRARHLLGLWFLSGLNCVSSSSREWCIPFLTAIGPKSGTTPGGYMLVLSQANSILGKDVETPRRLTWCCLTQSQRPIDVGDTHYKLTLSYIAIALAVSGRLEHCLNQDESGIQENYNRAKTDQTRCKRINSLYLT